MSAAPDNQAVLAALSRVQEPELHRDLVSLGMIKDLTLDAGRVGFTIELTTPACPLRDQIVREARQAVEAVPGVQQVEVRTTSNVRQCRACSRWKSARRPMSETTGARAA